VNQRLATLRRSLSSPESNVSFIETERSCYEAITFLSVNYDKENNVIPIDTR